MGVLDTLRTEAAVIASAPWSFATCVAAVAALIWAAVNGLYRNQVSDLKERIGLRDDTIADYRRQLNGATPDEAKARLDALEGLVDHLKPRELSDREALILTRHLGPLAPRRAEVAYAHGYAGCQEYAERLSEVLRGAGWRVQMNSVVAPFSKGIGLKVFAGLTPTDEAVAVFAGLNEARIAFEPVVDAAPDNALAFRILVEPRA